MQYKPSQKILKKYADVLVNFALGGGEGIKKGEVVYLMIDEYAKDFYIELRRTILKADGNLITDYKPSNDKNFNIDKDFFIYAKDQQIKFFPKKYLRGLVDEIDHKIFISSETNKYALKGVDPKKIMSRITTFKPYWDWSDEKENKGKLTWTLALYPTPAIAKEAKLSLKEYWNQVIKACFLNEKDPIRKWKSVYKKLRNYVEKLNKFSIDKLHVKGPSVDLWVKIGNKRQWVGCSGRNIPSFEIFTSPDWRGTKGWAKFNQPLYRYGNLIERIELKFKNGKVIEYKAKKNQKILKELIATKNADKIGEFSLTDKRFSQITKFMAETLYDENLGGPEGNFHIALGNAYHDCYNGNPANLSKKDWQQLGFNNSPVHSDIISTAPRIVTAYLKNGSNKIIYKNGRFVI
jgi:aminopeptidase